MGDCTHDEHELAMRTFAHDLLQSVTIIRAVVAASRQSAPSAEHLEANLALVDAEIEVMAELCRQHMEGPRRLTSIDLAEIAVRVVQRIEVAYSGQIETEVAATVLEMVDDSLAWERALMNLVENGCRAAGPNGKVSVRCFHRDGMLCVSVGDSGPGFGEAPAGRASLGIVSVTSLVDRHGGHMELRRSPLGGAQVTIVIPVPG